MRHVYKANLNMTERESYTVSAEIHTIELKDMSPASSRGTISTVPDDSSLGFIREDSSSFSDDIPSCSGTSFVSNNSDDIPSCSGTSCLSNNSDENDFSERAGSPFSINVVRKVKLRPDFRGIGITIAGGVYSPLGPEILPVFITGVDPGGPASLTGNIKVGDRIVAVNGENMIGRTHRDVVLAVKSAADNLTLEVTKGPEDIMQFVLFH